MKQGLHSGFELSEFRLDGARLRQDLKHANSTVLVAFEGYVGTEYQGQAIERLDCEAYESMAAEEGARLIQETLTRFDICDALLVQRTGRLVVGEPFYWIGVTANDEATPQAAIQYILEQMKIRIPLWCKAYFKDGSATWCDGINLAHIIPEEAVQSDEPIQEITEEKALGLFELQAPEIAEKIETMEKDDGFYKVDTTPLEPTIPEAAALTRSSYYQAQLIGLGEKNLQKLMQARVLVVGAGSLGSAALAYLAGVGLGGLSICDAERLQVSQVQRQSLYHATDIGKNKAILAAERLSAINPFIQVQVHPKKLERHNAQSLFNSHDLILDCTNDSQSRSLLNEAAVAFQKPLIQVNISEFEGQVHLYHPAVGGCLRCQWPSSGPSGNVGVLGPVVGTFGMLQALEAIKFLTGLPTVLDKNVLHFNLLTSQSQLLPRAVNPYCPVCQSYLRHVPASGTNTSDSTEMAADPDWMVFIDTHNEAQLSGYVLIDVSETREHTTFPGHPCLNMPFSRFNLENPRLDRNHRYLLYCQKGTRSLHLTRELRRRGINNVFALAGGVARFRPAKEEGETSEVSPESHIAFINSSAG